MFWQIRCGGSIRDRCADRRRMRGGARVGARGSARWNHIPQQHASPRQALAGDQLPRARAKTQRYANKSVLLPFFISSLYLYEIKFQFSPLDLRICAYVIFVLIIMIH